MPLDDARSSLLATLDARLLSGRCPRTPELFIRASHMCECTICGRLYIKHPLDPEYDWLRVHCDGTRLKL